MQDTNDSVPGFVSQRRQQVDITPEFGFVRPFVDFFEFGQSL
jgi:hypothetical protein